MASSIPLGEGPLQAPERPLLPEEGQDLPGVEGEVHAPEDLQFSEALADALEL